jgi:Zn-dependent protease
MPSFDPIYIIAILIALTVHEWSHAIVATYLGDPTPHDRGRLTLNPLAHLDPWGALMFLFIGFGWAKPVPINPGYFRSQKTGVLLTSIAGPVSNLILAILSFFLLTFIMQDHARSDAWSLLDVSNNGSAAHIFFARLLGYSLFVNLGLMAFNLLPIAPLDGSKVLQALIPPHLEDRYEEIMEYGPYILMGLLVWDVVFGFSILSIWITPIMNAVLSVLEMVVGAR